MTHPQSIVLITDEEVFFKRYKDIHYFFQTADINKKNLLIYSPQPLADISEIKKIPANEIILLNRKDFFFNFALKSSIAQTINKESYSFVIHYNNHFKTCKKTILISRYLNADIKITNLTSFVKKIKFFSIALEDSNAFFNHVYELLLKTSK